MARKAQGARHIHTTCTCMGHGRCAAVHLHLPRHSITITQSHHDAITIYTLKNKNF